MIDGWNFEMKTYERRMRIVEQRNAGFLRSCFFILH